MGLCVFVTLVRSRLWSRFCILCCTIVSGAGKGGFGVVFLLLLFFLCIVVVGFFLCCCCCCSFVFCCLFYYFPLLVSLPASLPVFLPVFLPVSVSVQPSVFMVFCMCARVHDHEFFFCYFFCWVLRFSFVCFLYVFFF